MSAWKDFVTASLIGTEAGQTTLALPTALEEAVAPAETLSVEARFLSRAGAFAWWRRAGHQPMRLKAAALPPCPPEIAPMVSSASTGHLRMMLGGYQMEALDGWLEEVRRRRLRLPPESLPDLLDMARRNRSFRPLLMAAGGTRVHWLAEQNLGWRFAEAESVDHWETGTRDQRLSILRGWRASEPEQARKKLQEMWKTEPSKTRLALLELMADHLADADEPFLERVLDERDHEFRLKAIDLLGRLPNSAFVARMTARVTPLLTFKRGGLLRRASLEAALPSEPDETAIRDGLDFLKSSNVVGLGEAVALVPLLAAIPLRHWTERFRCSPAELLAAAKNNAFADALSTGWATAAIRQEDASWAGALLDADTNLMCYSPPAEVDLFRILPEEERTRRLITSLRDRPESKIRDPIWWYLRSYLDPSQGCFSEPAALEFIAALHRLADDAEDNGKFNGYTHQWESAKKFVSKIPPHVIPESFEDWPVEKRKEIAQMIELLTFRRTTFAALAQL